jgi:hypothetical protein
VENPLAGRTPPPSGVTRDTAWVEREYGREKWPAVDAILDDVLARLGQRASMPRALAEVDRAARRAARPSPALSEAELAAGAAVVRSLAVESLVGAADGADLVIELGAGWGYNVLQAAVAGGPLDALYVAAELTPAGRRVAERLAALPGAPRFLALPYDHRRAQLGGLPPARRAAVLTCHSVEQVPALPEETIGRVAAIADEVVCVHLEPVGWQEGLGPAPLVAREYAERNDYNRDLLPVLRRLAARGAIRLEHVEVPRVAWLKPQSAGCLVRWRAGAGGAGG